MSSQALGDEELDHTKLFDCSTKCNEGNGQQTEQTLHAHVHTKTASSTTHSKKSSGKARSGVFAEDAPAGGGWEGAERGGAGHVWEEGKEGRVKAGDREVQRVERDAGGREEKRRGGEGSMGMPSSVGESDRTEKETKGNDDVHKDSRVGHERKGVLQKGVLLSESQIKQGSGNDRKIHLLLADDAPKRGNDNAWHWVRVGLEGWRDVAKGNLTLGVHKGGVEAIYASYVLQVTPLPSHTGIHTRARTHEHVQAPS